MEILRLDHVNLRTTQIDVMIAWYTDILGMHIGVRPNFRFDGVWMYTGDLAAVHLVTLEASKDVDVTSNNIDSKAGLKLEHFAFAATGLNQFVEKLEQKDIAYRRADIPDINVIQINLWDPDGNHVHLDFINDE